MSLAFGEGSSQLEGGNPRESLYLLVDDTFKPSKHCLQAANKSRSIILIRRSVLHLAAKELRPNYTSLVQPILKYATRASKPYPIRNVQHLERFLRLKTFMVKSIHNLSYEDLLFVLNLPTLKDHRSRGENIMAYSVQHGKYNAPVELVFIPPLDRGCCENNWKVYLR